MKSLHLLLTVAAVGLLAVKRQEGINPPAFCIRRDSSLIKKEWSV